jgi:hypothetical protein
MMPRESACGLILGRLALIIVLVIGAMPTLLNITVTPKGEGPVLLLDICHAAQGLATAGTLLPMAPPVRIEDRVAVPMFGAPPPFLIHSVANYLPDINPPPPR